MSSSSETKIFNRLINTAIASGFAISVHDGEEWAVKRSTDKRVISSAAKAVEMAELTFRTADGVKVGWVSIIWGNAPDGSELIADYTVSPEMEDLVKTVEA